MIFVRRQVKLDMHSRPDYKADVNSFLTSWVSVMAIWICKGCGWSAALNTANNLCPNCLRTIQRAERNCPIQGHVTEKHSPSCQCAVCSTGRWTASLACSYLRSIFTPGLTFAYKIASSPSGHVAVLTFISSDLSALTVSETFRTREQAERWVSVGADAADSVALSSGGPCNTATLSPRGEFPGKSAC